ncbi:hypothetical protein OESDEN_08543 [Oesophagostomum dentatum]|uniref:Condensin complex subunit 1 C-terminal domain-containing protein n=1 Tax=Oesophagostomum dentatum TaxID=61180 RepID=A0A0B1T632_OESDE|nr:hypothetical protein OESDEN_08543 [Oesophagostomum dentatum]
MAFILKSFYDTLKQTAEKFFDSISPGLSRILKELIENDSSSLICDRKLEETSTEKVMEKVKSLLFFPDSVRDALSAFVKLFYLGRFDNISREQPKAELVASLLTELRAQFLNVPKEVIGVCDENANVVPSSQTDLSEESHLIARRQRHLEVVEADEEDGILAMKALSALAIGNAITMREHFREFQKYIRGSNTALACEALRALSHFYPIVPSDKTAENLETYRLRAFDSLFADVEKLLFQLLLSDEGSDAATHWYNGVRNAVHLVFGLSSEVDYLISRITGKAFWYAKRSADVVLAYADSEGEQETAISYRKRREYLYRKWQQTTERTLMLVGEVIEALIVHITGSFPREMKKVADMNEILRQSSDDPEENYGGFDENRSEIETDFAYESGLFNLRPTHDEDIEIVATIFPDGGAVEPKREPSSEVEPSDDAVQRNTERTASSTSVSDEEKQQENPSTVDDLIRTHLNRLMESSLLKPYTSLGICLTFVVSYMRNSKYPKPIRDAAVRTFSTFLLISPAVAERGAPFLFAVLSSDPDPHIREYLLTSAVDLLHRFPSMMESCALFLYRMASDEDVSVRLTTVLWLTRLLCNDMIKPRGSLSDVALCMITRESRETNRSSGRELAAAANKLFKELSKKGNLLLNVLPDIICRLARYGKEVSMAEFQTLVRRLLEMVGDKPHDIMVEKMCQRFDICSSEEAIKDNEKIAEYFSFFISQLTLSEKSLPKMHSFLPQFAPLLNNDVFFNDLISVIQSFLDSEPNAIARESADDLLRKVNFLHRKSLNEEERKNFLKSIGSADHENAAKGADDEEVAFTFDKCDQPVEYENS